MTAKEYLNQLIAMDNANGSNGLSIVVNAHLIITSHFLSTI